MRTALAGGGGSDGSDRLRGGGLRGGGGSATNTGASGGGSRGGILLP
jgi:hypothetical protein